jgi:putative transcriptional regulator
MIASKFSAVLGERLKKISTVSKDTGISRTTLTNLHLRKNEFISLKNLDILCSYLDCTVNEIFEYRKEA